MRLHLLPWKPETDLKGLSDGTQDSVPSTPCNKAQKFDFNTQGRRQEEFLLPWPII